MPRLAAARLWASSVLGPATRRRSATPEDIEYAVGGLGTIVVD
ncbi:MAG: hypothetical protein OXF41_16125 [bacterium]|nr:hypothetical protein [bacterium]